jgi:glycosyltransferase involved in cell wall biosynthesis
VSVSPPSFDVILPTHARPDTLALAVRSILDQTYPHFLLHVVGDGCAPETERVIESFEDPRLRFYSFPKAPGYGYANRNRVLRQTSAPYVAYMSDDDLSFPDRLESAAEELIAGADLVAFRSCPVRPPGVADPFFFAWDWPGPARLLRHWFIGAPEMAHRRSVFDTLGYWDETLLRFGDRELYGRVRSAGLRAVWDEKVVLLRFYAQHWAEVYGSLPEPPQRLFGERLRDPDWCQGLRQSIAARRPLSARFRQMNDFAGFARRRGPAFLRYLARRSSQAAG